MLSPTRKPTAEVNGVGLDKDSKALLAEELGLGLEGLELEVPVVGRDDAVEPVERKVAESQDVSLTSTIVKKHGLTQGGRNVLMWGSFIFTPKGLHNWQAVCGTSGAIKLGARSL